MCDNFEVKNLAPLNELLLKVQIEGIQKEIQTLKTLYYNTIADCRFERIRNIYEWDAEETTALADKLEIYKAMYLEIAEYLCQGSKEANEELILKYYPECANLPEEAEFQPKEQIYFDLAEHPFD